MKNIGITSRLIIEDKHSEIRDGLDIKWVELLHCIGFIPILIPTGIDYENYIKSLNIDGVIFSGGDDLFTISRNNLSELRDKKEKIILNFAIKESIPVFGVCRGMQFIAHYFGSTLKKISNHVAINHNIETLHPFWGSEYLKSASTVNSYHNYGIELLSDELLSVAIADDGSVEAFIHKTLKIFGQMWHPEREEPFKAFDIELIKIFFNN